MATKSLREFPDPDSIRGLARGLRTPESTIVVAAAESLGLDVKSRSQLADLLPSSDGLTDVQVAAVQQVVWAMLHPHVDIGDSEVHRPVGEEPVDDVAIRNAARGVMAMRSQSYDEKTALIMRLLEGLSFAESVRQITAMDVPDQMRRDLISRLPVASTGT